MFALNGRVALTLLQRPLCFVVMVDGEITFLADDSEFQENDFAEERIIDSEIYLIGLRRRTSE
jgi:hypothetical protein